MGFKTSLKKVLGTPVKNIEKNGMNEMFLKWSFQKVFVHSQICGGFAFCPAS